jgi:mRNA-degrading endonuclease toxin of MazEF toxin-antitoxin module
MMPSKFHDVRRRRSLSVSPPLGERRPSCGRCWSYKPTTTNSRLANLLVAGITSNLKNAADPAHHLIKATTVEGQQSGLTRDSLVSCINLAVIPRRDVDRAIGRLSAAAMQHVDGCLRAALAL